MTRLELEAVYENGVLKLERTLPLEEGQRIRVTLDVPARRNPRGYGLLGWTGDPKEIERVALDPEFGIEESP